MVASTVEKIQVILQTVTTGFAKGLERTQRQLKNVGKNMQNFGSVMQMPMENFKQINGHMKVMQNVGGRVAKRFRMMTHGMRGFRMEALGVMFFGMMMQKMFMGLLRPVMEAFGVFDIFRIMLLTLFMPVMEMIFPFLLSMMEWFMNLPQPVKKAIGIFVVLGAIFATIIMILGQFALGIGSLIQFFPVLGGVIKAIGAVIAGAGGVVLAVIAAIIAIVIGMRVAWKENFENMRQFTADFVKAFKGIFEGFFKFWKNLIKLVVAIFTLDFKGAVEAIKDMFSGLWKFLKSIFLAIMNFAAMVALGVIRVFQFLVEKIIAFFKWLYNKLVGHSIIPDIVNGIIKWFWKIPNMIKSMVNSVANIFVGLGNSIINVWNSVLGTVGKVIIKILRMADKAIAVVSKLINIPSYSWRISWKNLPGIKNIPFLASGGIVTKPTLAMIGEAGPEAVVPLGKNKGIGESAIITQENHFHGFTMDDLNRELDNRDRRLVDDIRRLVKQ